MMIKLIWIRRGMENESPLELLNCDSESNLEIIIKIESGKNMSQARHGEVDLGKYELGLVNVYFILKIILQSVKIIFGFSLSR